MSPRKETLQKILEDFYDRVFADTMIGFYFHGRDKQRLIEKELELTLAIFGESINYSGKPIKETHLALRIMGGHFDRRNQILIETITDHGLPSEEAKIWIEHSKKMRHLITRDKKGDCFG